MESGEPNVMSLTLRSEYSDDLLTPLEQDVIEEYERLARNMSKFASVLKDMGEKPITEVLDGLRQLERKTGLVFTLLKASVYSIVLQQEIYSGDAQHQPKK
ncbi:DASH complex subunit dad3 [Erysiphe necator]|uniref:DASH complex subunit DAD3 n=1 Tax=Uncinula necator TaxID=52586 RepID=A0A0B1P647_UNCNE|nr:DASH complex subunit dad3 [Erysiphe necator]KHJ33738.1 putative dash complex subunit dad3 [Erysiphe necator]